MTERREETVKLESKLNLIQTQVQNVYKLHISCRWSPECSERPWRVHAHRQRPWRVHTLRQRPGWVHTGPKCPGEGSDVFPRPGEGSNARPIKEKVPMRAPVQKKVQQTMDGDKWEELRWLTILIDLPAQFISHHSVLLYRHLFCLLWFQLEN